MPINAVVLVHPDRLLPNAAICYQYCLALGYNAVGLVRSWEEAINVNRADPGTADVAAEVVIVADEAELPPDRRPRLEVVSLMRPEIYFQAKAQFNALENGDGPVPAIVSPSRRERTRVIRRSVAG